jgi:hypothetical protein
MPSLKAADAATILLSAACSRNVPGSAGGDAEAVVVYTRNGWSQAERDRCYHMAKGSELMPYTLPANVTSVKTEKPFL